MREALLENARLDFEGSLAGGERLLRGMELGESERAEALGDAQRDNSRQHREHADRKEDALAIEAQGLQGNELAIGGEPAEPDQHAHQHAHGQRKREDARQRAGYQQGDGTEARRTADHQVHQPDQLRDEEDEGKNE